MFYFRLFSDLLNKKYTLQLPPCLKTELVPAKPQYIKNLFTDGSTPNHGDLILLAFGFRFVSYGLITLKSFIKALVPPSLDLLMPRDQLCIN